MVLPEIQRGYVWGREQVRGLFQSLYRGHPVKSLLVWATSASTAAHRGDGKLAPGVVKLLLDGQQRIIPLLWRDPRRASEVLRQQCEVLYRVALEPRDQGVWVLSADKIA